MNAIKQQLACSVLLVLAGTSLSVYGRSDNPQTNASTSAASAITRQVNATAGGLGVATDDPVNKYTYFNLETGQVVELTDVAAETSSDWHIAFKRLRTKLNGGVSGPGSVTGAVADAQDDFYDTAGDANASVFINATADTELDTFEAVTDVSALSFESDRNIATIIGDGGSSSWWSYNPTTHTVEAAPNNWWLVKSAAKNGKKRERKKSYAKMHVTNIVQESREISLEMFIQGVGESAFSSTATTYTAVIGSAGGSKCYDFDSASEVDCSAAAKDWDLKVEVSSDGFSWNIWSNGGVFGEGEGGVFWEVPTAQIDDFVSGTVTSGGFNFSAHYKPDTTGGLFVDNDWWGYGFQGRHKVWPNYRVYAIDTGAEQYKLQILSYYDEAGTSGMIKFRYESL